MLSRLSILKVRLVCMNLRVDRPSMLVSRIIQAVLLDLDLVRLLPINTTDRTGTIRNNTTRLPTILTITCYRRTQAMTTKTLHTIPRHPDIIAIRRRLMQALLTTGIPITGAQANTAERLMVAAITTATTIPIRVCQKTQADDTRRDHLTKQ